MDIHESGCDEEAVRIDFLMSSRQISAYRRDPAIQNGDICLE
jgi:hypothetical protein